MLHVDLDNLSTSGALSLKVIQDLLLQLLYLAVQIELMAQMDLLSVLSIPRLSLTRVLASGVILNLESKHSKLSSSVRQQL